jgi:outer membrane lipoprotein-sorting protein
VRTFLAAAVYHTHLLQRFPERAPQAAFGRGVPLSPLFFELTGMSPRQRNASVRLGPMVVGLLLASLVWPSQVTAQEALEILQSAADRHQAISGFCADFRQVVENDILRETTRSRGQICQADSDRFEMRFSDPPDGDRVVADGEHLWIYLPSADPGQVFQGAVNGGGGQFDLHREFLSEPGQRYAPTLEGRDEVDGRETWVLFLEPMGRSPFLRARIWVDAADFMVRKLEITEDEGFVRMVELSDLEVNPTIPPERFQFEPPSGVQVIRR